MNTVSHVSFEQSNALRDTLKGLSSTLTMLADSDDISDFGQYEQQVHAAFTQAEREVLSRRLQEYDVDQPALMIDGVRHKQVLKSAATYMSAVGPLRVTRCLYREGKEKSVSPMEFKAGVIEGYWTPLAAKQAIWAVAHLTPGESEALFCQLGNMTPSKSSLDRLPKGLSQQWEAQRETYEAELRACDVIPDAACTVAISLDGVMMPMKQKCEPGKSCYKEASCATLSYFDEQGERLKTVRMGRMPESKKVTLKSQLTAELEHALQHRPALKVVKIADGAKDNWRYLKQCPSGFNVIDYYHAAEHLQRAFEAAYGPNSTQAKVQSARYREALLVEERGVNKVIRALLHLVNKYPRRESLKKELNYFRGHRHQMNYAQLRQANLPIGSGVVEAACKTLVAERLKRSGMRWNHPGGQAILSFRGLLQSKRFEHAWQMLAQCYKADVSLGEERLLQDAA